MRVVDDVQPALGVAGPFDAGHEGCRVDRHGWEAQWHFQQDQQVAGAGIPAESASPAYSEDLLPRHGPGMDRALRTVNESECPTQLRLPVL